MIFDFGQLVIVKRYLWVSLAIAILPLLLIATLYNEHSSNLTDRLVLERMEGDLDATLAKIDAFIESQHKRLNTIADLPEISTAFSTAQTGQLPPRLLDFLYLAIGDPDIYSIAFYRTSGELVRAFPSWSQGLQSTENMTINSLADNAEIIGPALPEAGRPGWFLVKKPVLRDGKEVGIVTIKVRLTSMTEQASELYRQGIYEPIIITPDADALSAVGHVVRPQQLLAESEPFLPGWRIALQQSGDPVTKPEIRHWLLLVVIVSALCVTGLFLNMSSRLARMITPLNNAAQAIAKGNLSSRVPDTGPGELGTLARSFNNMTAQLSQMIQSRVYAERQASLGTLATGIAHEIRNPLATIRTTVHGLMHSETDSERKAMLNAVNQEVIRTDAIVEEFMNYARPREPHKESVVISDMLQKVFTLSSAAAMENGVQLSTTGDTSLILYMDSGQLNQVLMNLILNALDAMPDGGHLHIRTHREGSQAVIDITDTGDGIKPEQLEAVQTPFFTTKKGGTGLGLAICSQLVQANAGQMEIDSTVGEGTRVRLRLPLMDNAAG